MLHWMVPFLVAIVAAGAAEAADQTATRPAAQRAARNLPAGLPRPHYNYHTTVTAGAPYPAPRVYVQTPVADEGPEVLFTPDPVGGYIANLPGTPILPGSSTLPGYYGRPFDYDYQGAYYGGPYVGYFWRLPYACGIYGYC